LNRIWLLYIEVLVDFFPNIIRSCEFKINLSEKNCYNQIIDTLFQNCLKNLHVCICNYLLPYYNKEDAPRIIKYFECAKILFLILIKLINLIKTLEKII